MLDDETRLGLGSSLSDVILAREEASRLQAVQREASYLEKTAPLRAYLIELTAQADESLARFQIDEVLGEALKYYPGFVIKTLVPAYYYEILCPTSPHLRYSVGSSNIGIDELANPDNFQRVIPSLIGYGRVLEKVRVEEPSSRVIGYKKVLVSPGSAGSAGGSWGGSGDSGALRYSGTEPQFRTEAILEEGLERIKVTTTMAVETVASRQENVPSYDLRYRYTFTEKSLYSRHSIPPLRRALAPYICIPFNASTDTFKNIMADQIIRERRKS